jgi:hypothetical protein
VTSDTNGEMINEVLNICQKLGRDKQLGKLTRNWEDNIEVDLKETSLRKWSSSFSVLWGGVRLSPLHTSATIWLIVPAPDDR